MTSFENLYYESTVGFDGIGDSTQGVAVAIRRWFSDYAPISKSDAIMQTVMIIDGEVVDTRKFLPVNQELSWYQRHGIAAFDEAVANHPHASQLKVLTHSA